MQHIWLLKMKNGGVFWPVTYMHGECHKVQDKHFENPYDLGGIRALPQGDGLVQNGCQSVFLGPYGIPHA